MKNLFLISICLITFLSSCKKENDVKNNGLIGKWKLVETLDTFNGGHTWISVPHEGSHTVEFSTNGDFVKIEAAGGINAICTGEYVSLPDFMIKVNSPCHVPDEMIRVSAISSIQLVLDRQGIGSVIKYKYKAVK